MFMLYVCNMGQDKSISLICVSDCGFGIEKKGGPGNLLDVVDGPGRWGCIPYIGLQNSSIPMTVRLKAFTST